MCHLPLCNDHTDECFQFIQKSAFAGVFSFFLPLRFGQITGFNRFPLKSNQTAIITASCHVIGVREPFHVSRSLFYSAR